MRLFIALTLLLAFNRAVFSENSLSYANDSIPFAAIDNVNREAEAWGVCAAAYDIAAELLETNNPAQAKQVRELGNGAEMAVIMSHVSDGLTKDITPERFNALWNYSKTLGTSISESQMNMMLADAERLAGENPNLFVDKITSTINVCKTNLESQQIYIDLWRELAKSGLLKLPQG